MGPLSWQATHCFPAVVAGDAHFLSAESGALGAITRHPPDSRPFGAIFRRVRAYGNEFRWATGYNGSQIVGSALSKPKRVVAERAPLLSSQAARGAHHYD